MQVDAAARWALVCVRARRTDAQARGMDEKLLGEVSSFNSANYIRLKGSSIAPQVARHGREIVAQEARDDSDA